MGCCSGTSRVLLFIINLAQMLVALTVIGLAIWIRVDDNFESEIRRNIKYDMDPEPMRSVKSDIRTGILVSFWVIIGFAIACALLGLAGFLGAAAKSRALLVLYFIIQLIVALLEIAIGIYVLVKRPDVRTTVKNYVYLSYQMNSQPDTTAFQNRYHCCGAENLSNLQCFQPAPNCSGAVWDRLDFTMMIFGIAMILVVVLQILAVMLSVLVFAPRKRESA